MKEKIKKILMVAGLGLSLLVFSASSVSADNSAAATTSSTTKGAGILPCGGNEQDAASQLLNNPSDTTLNNYRNSSCQFSDLFKLIARITNMLVGFAGIYAIFLIIIAGYRMVFSAGNAEMLSAGKEGLSNAVIGFVLVMIAYVIVNTIFELFNTHLTGQSNGFLYNPFIGQ